MIQKHCKQPSFEVSFVCGLSELCGFLFPHSFCSFELPLSHWEGGGCLFPHEQPFVVAALCVSHKNSVATMPVGDLSAHAFRRIRLEEEEKARTAGFTPQGRRAREAKARKRQRKLRRRLRHFVDDAAVETDGESEGESSPEAGFAEHVASVESAAKRRSASRPNPRRIPSFLRDSRGVLYYRVCSDDPRNVRLLMANSPECRRLSEATRRRVVRGTREHVELVRLEVFPPGRRRRSSLF